MLALMPTQALPPALIARAGVYAQPGDRWDNGQLACPGAPSPYGVAHRTLPCGTRVVLCYRGQCVRSRVVDSGPHGITNGTGYRVLTRGQRMPAGWNYRGDIDVRAGTARALGFSGGTITWTVSR